MTAAVCFKDFEVEMAKCVNDAVGTGFPVVDHGLNLKGDPKAAQAGIEGDFSIRGVGAHPCGLLLQSAHCVAGLCFK